MLDNDHNIIENNGNNNNKNNSIYNDDISKYKST